MKLKILRYDGNTICVYNEKSDGIRINCLFGFIHNEFYLSKNVKIPNSDVDKNGRLIIINIDEV